MVPCFCFESAGTAEMNQREIRPQVASRINHKTPRLPEVARLERATGSCP
jgi:hypothetical protein